MKLIAFLLIILSLTGCAEAQQTSEQKPVRNGANVISTKTENSTDLQPQTKIDFDS